MKYLAFITLSLSMLSILFLPVSAIAEEKEHYFVSKIGIYSPESDDLEGFDTGLNTEFALGHFFNPNFALELGLGYLETDADFRGSDLTRGNFVEHDEIRVIPLTLSAKGLYPLNTKARLFAEGGGGLYFSDAALNLSTSLAGDHFLDDSDTPFGVHLGIGLIYDITEELSLGVEGRYFWADAEFSDSNIIDLELDLDGLLVRAGLTYYFGGKKKATVTPVTPPKDSDGDGVYDGRDQCPDTPPGVRVDRSGCPLDSDGDGVYDDRDQCPDTPKGVQVDESGCPPDSDGDGVYDDRDQCPDTPKGVKVDKQGCPLDTDADGVYDYKDACPDTPQGATVDRRGCWVLRGVNFDTDKWDIKPIDHSILDEVVSILGKNPKLMLEVQGHTDNKGTAAHNQSLSERRAQAVMEYLIEKGIAKDRLNAVGYGLTKPAATNETSKGRAQNRRVELNPIF
ncbi:MAG: OmpA family protein [Pseudomonadota bacterium]